MSRHKRRKLRGIRLGSRNVIRPRFGFELWLRVKVEPVGFGDSLVRLELDLAAEARQARCASFLGALPRRRAAAKRARRQRLPRLYDGPPPAAEVLSSSQAIRPRLRRGRSARALAVRGALVVGPCPPAGPSFYDSHADRGLAHPTSPRRIRDSALRQEGEDGLVANRL